MGRTSRANSMVFFAAGGSDADGRGFCAASEPAPRSRRMTAVAQEARRETQRIGLASSMPGLDDTVLDNPRWRRSHALGWSGVVSRQALHRLATGLPPLALLRT